MPHAGKSIDVTPGTKTQVARQVSETRIVLKGLEDSDLRALTRPCTEYCPFCWTVKHYGEEGTATMPDTFEEQGKYVRSTPVHRAQGSLAEV
jgi:L-lysine 2,3-aminomutase